MGVRYRSGGLEGGEIGESGEEMREGPGVEGAERDAGEPLRSRPRSTHLRATLSIAGIGDTAQNRGELVVAELLHGGGGLGFHQWSSGETIESFSKLSNGENPRKV